MLSPEGSSADTRTFSRVRDVRLAKGLTCAGLAADSGISTATLWRIERGLVRPLRSTQRVLANALGCDESELFPSDAEGRTCTPATVHNTGVGTADARPS